MKKVMTFGTFDIFHPGHRSFLKQAKKYGDCLIVVVARDKNVTRYKKQETRNNEQKRIENIKKSRLANKVILGGLGNKYAVIKKHKPDVICLGYDQQFFTRDLKEKLKSYKLEKTRIIRLKAYKPEIYKSSKIKNRRLECLL